MESTMRNSADIATLPIQQVCSEVDLQHHLQKCLDAPQKPGHHAWLIKGDFDHIKAFNDVYGKEIVDHLLDWAIDLVIEAISAFQSKHRLSGITIAVMG